MALGPFATYVPPGVYSRTLTEANVASLVAGLRIPTLIGVGQEELEQDDLELVRGSSSTLDQQIVNEDISLSWIVDDTNPNNPVLGANNGTLSRFVVKNAPIVDGQGFGRVTNDVRSVSVTVNGVPVAVGAVRGASGQVILQVPPQPTDNVRITYFFHRGDTAFVDDVSDQVSTTPAMLISPGYAPFSVVAGVSDTFKLKVNGGAEKTVTFVASPSLFAQITIPGVDINGGVTYTAVTAGAAGNLITVEHVVAGISTPLSIGVVGTAITVNVGTDGGGSVASSANQIVAAILLSGPASALVVATATGTGASLTAASGITSLVGGLDGGSASSLKTQIDAALITGLSTAVFTANDGSTHLQLLAASSLQVTTGNANGILGFSNNQLISNNASFQVFQRPIVDGTSGGITTTDPSKVVVKVNGSQVIPSSVDGKNGFVTLPLAPPPGAVVTINYWANTWQDTFDYLPNTLVTNVIRSGISPGRSDYIQGTDFVVANPSPDVSIIHWGTSFSISSTLRSPGAEPFDSTQILPTLVDDKLYLAPCVPFTDTSVVPAAVSSTVFILPEIPTTGNGRDTPLGLTLFNAVTNSRSDLATNRPDLIQVYAGSSLSDAMNRSPVKVLSVDSSTLKVTLASPIPPNWKVYATFWYNRIVNDTYILTCVTPGPVGTGQYNLFSTLNNANLFQTRFTIKGGGLTQTVHWPRGVETVPDAFHHGGAPVSETVRVTFGVADPTGASFTTRGAAPFSFYTPASGSWRTALNGGGTVVTNLATAAQARLVSKPVSLTAGGGTAIAIPIGSNDLELTIDEQNILVTLPTGATITPATIASTINTAIDNNPAFTGTAPNNLCTFYVETGAGLTVPNCYFVIKSYSTPAALPGGFDSVPGTKLTGGGFTSASNVHVRQGTAETLLGFTTFQSADGSSTSLNKPATLIGTKAQAFAWTLGVNDTFKVRVNGIDYTVTIQVTSTTAAAVVSDINAVIPSTQGAASVGTLGNLNHVRITSATNGDQSSVIILDGTANTVLGFNQGDLATQTRVSAQDVVNSLMSTVGFFGSGNAVAYPVTVNGNTYIQIDSLVAGAASSITFPAGANSAFNILSGTKINAGVDGDNGSATHNNFTVTSTNPLGSAGVGIPGQTYTDAITGLRFTVLAASTGSYATGGYFEMDVSQTFNVNPAIPYYAIPGCELIVSNTVNVGVNDTGIVTTFARGGVQPKNGDFYFISYRYMKQDFTTKIFRQFKTIEANFGALSAENRVTLGAYLAILNGAVLVGIKQVLKVPNTNQANAQSFIDAINELATPLPGNIKPDILVPLGTDTSIYSYLTNHCEVQSNIRNQSERMGYIGFASGTSPTNAQTIARSLQSQRMMAFYPDSAVITLSNELGETFETLVDGTFFAAAVAGSAVSPSVDVATPFTRRRLQGFTRIPRILDAVEANQTAVAGVTLLEDLSTVIRIRQGLTTNMTSILTRLPTVTQIADYVSQQTRTVLDSFVGTKFLASRTSEVEVSMTSLFKQLVQQEIVGAFTGISAAVSPDDPTVLTAEAFYQPIFPLLYLVLTFNLRARL